jgi:hypothetical protein
MSLDETMILDTLDALTGTLGALTERVEQLENYLSDPANRLDPVDLPAWVDWLIERFRLEDKIPTHWDTIPGVGTELAALRAAWVVAHDKAGNPRRGFDAVQWHDALDRAIHRISDVWVTAARRRPWMENDAHSQVV